MLLNVIVLLGLIAASADSFLVPYQERFAELSNRITWGLTVARETNRVQNRALREDILVEIANGTVALRRIRYETNQKVATFRKKPEAIQDCLDSVDASLDSLFVKAEQFLQLCVTDLYTSLQWDAEGRFYPLTAELQEESLFIVRTGLDALAETNPVLFPEEIEGRLDGELDHYGELWFTGQQRLEEDLKGHEELMSTVVQTINECAEGLVDILPRNIDNILYFAENYCLEVEVK